MIILFAITLAAAKPTSTAYGPVVAVGEVRDRFGRRPQDVCLKAYNDGKGDWWMRLVRDQNEHGVAPYSDEREATFDYCAGFIDGLKEAKR